MHVEIVKYNPAKHYSELMEIIREEGEDWADYLTPAYQKALELSITYMALLNDQVCGFSRSIDDNGIYTWVIDLLVDKKFRGHSIGRQLMECLLIQNPHKEVYVLSDVDDYYKKLGYPKEGSVFQVRSLPD